jgi:hypothetical protein
MVEEVSEVAGLSLTSVCRPVVTSAHFVKLLRCIMYFALNTMLER